MTNYHSIYTEIDKIIEQVNQGTFSFSKFDGDFFSWKRIELPSDFEYLIASVSNLLTEDNQIIRLDLADIISVCQLDLNTKTCKNGHLELLEVSCDKHNISIFENVLKQIPNYRYALLYVTGDINLREFTDMRELIENHAMFDANILFGVKIQKRMVNRYKIQVVCYIPDSLPKNYGNQDDNVHMN